MRQLVKIVVIITVMFSAAISLSARGNGKVTEAEIKKCVAQKKSEAAKRGYPVTDPFAVRIQCTKKLSGEK